MDRLEHAKNLLAISGHVSLSYNRESKVFDTGGTATHVDVALEKGLSYSMADADLTRDEVEAVLQTEPLIYTPTSIIALPKFQQFVDEAWDESVGQDVISAMAEVMPMQDEFMKPSQDHLGFRATRIDREMGRLVLQVPGNCTCIGPDATGSPWDEKMWEYQIMSYTPHNVAMPAQKTALLAGLGHIATLAR